LGNEEIKLGVRSLTDSSPYKIDIQNNIIL